MRGRTWGRPKPPSCARCAQVRAVGVERRPMQFRPCIDLHKGKVKQIVGSTLSDLEKGAKKK